MDSKEFESFILEHEKKLVHFHMHDAAGNKNHLALGKGEIDLKEKFEIAGKRNCRCVLETKTVQALRESVVWLQENGMMER